MRFALTMKWRWVFALSGVVLLMITIPLTTEAHGRRWSGIDPRADINGHQLNVRVEWYKGNACDVEGPIQVLITVPIGSDVRFMGESAERFDCDNDGVLETTIATQTTIVEARTRGRVIVSSVVRAPGTRFPTRVEIYKDMKLTDVCRRSANKWIVCKGPKF